jgi:aminopeptidase-like protein
MQDLIDLIERNYLKNRTIVSRDVPGILEDVAKACGVPLALNRFASGADYATWVIPDRWDVREAWVKGPDGRIIASYRDHPLFLAPYSIPFEGALSLAELKQHIRSHPTQSNAFYYEHRLAYDFRRRLQEWIITLPSETVESLAEGTYQVKLDLDIGPGEMLVGELVLPGDSEDRIVLMADYCHPGQVNDSFSGLAALIATFRRLKALPRRKYSYHFFIFPETVGSCALLSSRPELLTSVKAAIFSEFVGWGDRWVVSVSDMPGSLAHSMAQEAHCHDPTVEVVGLFEGWGNDEYVFDYAGVPSLAVQQFDCPEYHSSNDEPSRLRAVDLQRASDIMLRMCLVAEEDALYRRRYPVPIYMTRFDLYLDAVAQRAAFKERRNILYGIDGKTSLLEIAVKYGIDFDVVKSFAKALADNELIERVA